MREEKNVTDETKSGVAEPTDLVLSDGDGAVLLPKVPGPAACREAWRKALELLLLRALGWKYGVGEGCPASSGLRWGVPWTPTSPCPTSGDPAAVKSSRGQEEAEGQGQTLAPCFGSTPDCDRFPPILYPM